MGHKKKSVNLSIANSVLSSALIAIILATLEITFVIAYGAMIFPEQLSEYFPNAVGILLLGTIICFAVLALFSSYPGTIGSAQDIPASICAVMASSVITMFAVNTDTHTIYSTVIIIMAISSLLTAILLIISAVTGMSKIIRYIPFPVIGGILISTGWILSNVGLEMMPEQWIIGVAFAVSLLFLKNKFASQWTMPVFLFSSIVAINLYLKISGISADEARSLGFLLNVHMEKIPLAIDHVKILASTNWDIVLTQIPTIISLSLICCIIVLIQISSIEIIVSQEMNPKHELYITGSANFLVGLCCGLTSYHHISSTALAYNMGAKTRMAGLLTAGFCMIVFFTNTRVLEYLPIPILGGLILYLGLDFIYDWLFKAYHKVPKSEYSIMLAIVLCTVFINLPAAIVFGFVCGILLFLFQYNKIRTVKTVMTGDACQSTVMRSPNENNFLATQSHSVAAFKLTGYIYFGTANTLFEEIKYFLHSSDQKTLKYFVLDFENVTNLDSTALMNLLRIHSQLKRNDIELLFSSNTDQQINLVRSFFSKNQLNEVFFAQTLDHAIEECENKMLVSEKLFDTKQISSFKEIFEKQQWDTKSVTRFKEYLEPTTLHDHQILIHRGSLNFDIYILTSGRVNIILKRKDGSVKRLRVLTPGMIIGEISLYTQHTRTAEAVSNGVATVYKLTIEQLRKIEHEDPQLAIRIHKFFAKSMAERFIDEYRLQRVRNY